MTEENDKKLSTVVIINREISRELTDPAVGRALLATTFKGLTEVTMKQAMLEGMLRGFTFQDFLKKDVYAIPFGGAYSLITSIDNNRKIAMRTGLYAGKTAPTFETETLENGAEKIISCTVAVKKILGSTIGEFAETVYFDEYTKKRDLWATKPRTMIAKVAEMHALRMAFPEELAKSYVEEEITPSRAQVAQEMVEESPLKMKAVVLDENKISEKIEEINADQDQK